jgi:signal transduction histidine kinase/CheY-like chemotaxis protein
MSVEPRFDLSNLAPHEIAELGARVRGAAGATFEAIARAIIDTIWDAFLERTPPVLALARLYRVGGSAIEVAADRTLDGAANAARIFFVEQLAREVSEGGARVELVTETIDHPRLAGDLELLTRYGTKAVIAVAAHVTGEDVFALVVYSRVAISRSLFHALESLALDVGVALARASDCRGDGNARAEHLERLLGMREVSLARHAAAMAREADAHRRRADELDRTIAKEREAASVRLQRTQRAMLNVVEDLGDARTDLERRVAKRTAELEHAKDEAQRANRAKDEFLAMLGHELRNPLAPILTALELMRLRAGDVLVRERTVIERQTTHLAKLVDDLLDVSRIARGVVKLNRAHVLVADVIAKAVEMAAPLFEQQRHELAAEVPRELAIDGDPERLAQVFANLLTNAAKYTDPGGHVVVTARAQGDEVEVRVSDNGRGISPELIPRVFDLFVQEQQNLDRARGGLGLGLAIARNVVQLHRGRIDATSAGIGRGSTFTVHLPRVPAESIEGVAPRDDRACVAPQDAGSILVVDDNRDAAILLCEMLATRGYTTHIAHEPAEALRIADMLVPDVAILDIGLPGMSGYDLARQLRELPRWERVRMVALTGYGQSVDRELSRQAGFEHHLVKPVDLATLERCLRRVKG